MAVFPSCFVMIVEKGFPRCVRGRQHSKTGNSLGTQREAFCLRCMWPDLFCSEVSKSHDTCKRISVDLSCDKKTNKQSKWGLAMQAQWREKERRTRGGQTYRLVGSPCVADHPARSCPLAGPLDCMLLLGSLKDQEENLIVVKTWT